jgi:hypothetical protein
VNEEHVLISDKEHLFADVTLFDQPVHFKGPKDVLLAVSTVFYRAQACCSVGQLLIVFLHDVILIEKTWVTGSDSPILDPCHSVLESICDIISSS